MLVAMTIKEGETDHAGERNHEEEKSFRRAEGRHWPLIWGTFCLPGAGKMETVVHTQVHVQTWWLGEARVLLQ